MLSKMRHTMAGLILALTCAMPVSAQTPVTTTFTYQGQLRQDGAPAEGLYDLRFTLHDAADGGNVVSGPLEMFYVNVAGGLFTVPLDFGAVYDSNARWIEVEVKVAEGAEYTLLSPRQELTGTPYALGLRLPLTATAAVDPGSAALALTATGGGGAMAGTTSGGGGEAAVSGITFGGASGVSGQCYDSSGDGVTGYSTYGNGVYGYTDFGWAGRFLGRVAVSGFLGVGTDDPQALLDLVGMPGLDGIRFPDGTVQTTAGGGGGGDSYWQPNGTGISYNVGGIGITGHSSPYAYGKGLFIEGGDTVRASVFAFNYDNFTPLNLILNSPGGNVGIGTASPTAKLHVAASSGNTIYGTTSGGRGVAGAATSNFGGIGVSGDHVQSGNYGFLGSLNGGVVGVAQVDGYVGGSFANTDGGTALEVTQGLVDIHGVGNGVELLKLTTERPWVFRQFGTGPSTALQLMSTSGIKEFHITAVGGTHVATFMADDANPIFTVNGRTRTKVLEITGADLAEKFPTNDEAVKPGTVMEIDPEHPGKLRIARGAYNARVAGVVSGANDFAAGAILGNLPGHDDAPAVALSGRVYVMCDATDAAIELGDLLTTSDTPGHAMKAVDRERGQGAVLGKAMTRLDKGETGFVLVLVNLQ
jgi:hypothetical protein